MSLPSLIAVALVLLVQAPVTIAGRVVAATSGAAVPGAIVECGAARTASAQNGQFALAVPAGPVRLSIRAPGFVTQEIDVLASASLAPLTIILEPLPQVREEVTVTGRRGIDTTAPAAVSLAPREVEAVAGASENVFKVLQTLPGVAATDDFGSRIAVRGGSPDENLTIMDGVEIHNPYRLFGLTSAFNPETIERFDLSAGGFSPQYGDRLSSLLVIDNRDGARNRLFGGSMSLALTDANIVTEGRLPARTRGSWLLTARRTYYDLVANRITNTSLPAFADVQAKIGWEPRAGQRLSFVGLRSREHTDAAFEGNASNDSIAVQNRSSNDLASVTWAAPIGSRLATRTIASWYRYNDVLNVDGFVRNVAQRSNAPDESAFSQATFIFARDLEIRDVSLRHESTWQAGTRQLVYAGVEIHRLQTVWGWQILGDRNPNEANGSSIQGGAGLPSFLQSSRTTTRAGVWLVDRIALLTGVRLEPGVRIDRPGVGGETTLSPRISGEMALGRGFRLNGALGRFTQSVGYEKVLQADYFVDLTPATANALRSARALHAVLGVERRFGPDLSVRVETYRKSYRGLVVGRLETEAERDARIAPYDFPAALASSVPTALQVTSVPTNGADGLAYGFDIFVQHRDTGRAGPRLTGWASYTWGVADMESYGRRYPLDYDRRHAASGVANFRWLSRIDLGATMRVASGFPFTPVADLRVAPVTLIPRPTPGAEAREVLVPARDRLGRLIWTTDFGGVDNLNSGRLPVFARLDIRVTFHPPAAGGRWLLYVDLVNALNRRNTSEYTPTLESDPTSDRPRLEYTSENALPFLPSVGVKVRF